MEPLRVSLPDPEHSHWDPDVHRFVTHSHVHAGPHEHYIHLPSGKPVVVNRPGNYSPKASR